MLGSYDVLFLVFSRANQGVCELPAGEVSRP